MARSDYEPIPLEGEPLSPTDDSNGHYPPSVVKPVTYYGEGEFDPPSSDDEEELLMEKLKRNASSDALEGAGDALAEDVELVIGGHKVPYISGTCIYSYSRNSRNIIDLPQFAACLFVSLLWWSLQQRSVYLLPSRTKVHRIRFMAVNISLWSIYLMERLMR